MPGLRPAYRGSSVQPATAFGPQSIAGQETTTSYEAGVKSDLFDRKARLSLSVFHYDVKNLQLTEVGGGGNTNTLKVAKKAQGQGVELNLDAYLTESLLVTLSGSYNDTKIKDPSLTVAGLRCALHDAEPLGGRRAVLHRRQCASSSSEVHCQRDRALWHSDRQRR